MKRQGSIKKVGRDSYRLRWYRGTREDGRRDYGCKTLTGVTRRHAERELAAEVERASLAKNAGVVSDTRRTLNQASDAFLKKKRAEGEVAESTIQNYEWTLAKHVRPYLGRVRLDQLTGAQIERWLQLRLADGVTRPALSQAKTVLSIVLGQSGLPINPCSSVRFKKGRAKPKRILTSDEARRFIQAMQGHPLEPYFALVLTTGMRNGEARALRWSDLDLDTRRATIRRSVWPARVQGAWQFREGGKTENAEREVPVPPEVVALLRAHRTRTLHHAPDDLVFATPTGEPWNHYTLARGPYLQILRKAELPEAVTLKNLRHSFGTLLAERDVPDRVIQDLMGHSDIAITKRFYIQATDRQRAEASEAARGVLFGGAEPRTVH